MRHSQRSSFNSCPYKFHLESMGLKKTKSGMEADDRTFGQAIHSALEAFYSGKTWSEVLHEYKKYYPEVREYKSKAKDYESGLALLSAYPEYWKEHDKMWEIIATELEADSTFNGEEHQLHIDIVAKHKQTGEVWAWDHKVTEKYLGKAFWKKYELDSQVTRYTNFIKDKYGSCGGFLINAIQVGHRQRAYKGEPAGYYQKFERQPFSRNEEQIKFWLESEKEWAGLIACCEEANSWPKHLGSLCGWCDYYEFCLSGGNENVKESLYGVEEEINIIDESQS